MKILQVYKDYYPPVKGGIEGHLNVLSRGLKRNGIEVEVLVSSRSGRFEKECIDGVQVTKAPQIGRFASAPLNLTFAYWLKKIGQDADLLHFHFPNPTGEISYLFSGLDKPVVVSYHSDIVRQKRLGKILEPLLKQFLNQTDMIIASSPNYLQTSEMLKHYRDKCTIVPYGIELSRFNVQNSVTSEVAKLRSYYGTPVVLFIGVFRYYKGLHILIEAMKGIDGKLLLIGSGPLEPEMRKLIYDKHLAEKILLLGELSDADLINHLHACDVFVLPSILRSEAFGIVQIEAMAAEKPIICTELNTGTSYVNRHEETGLVIPPNDVNSLMQAINYLLARPEIAKRLGVAGRNRAESYFTHDRMVEDIILTYRRVLDQKVITKPLTYPLLKDISPLALPGRRIKILRIISRLNIGGPSIHVHILTSELDRNKFESILLTGQISPFEGDMSYLFNSMDEKPVIIPDLQREISFGSDVRAFSRIFKVILNEKPDIVHTHTAKAGSSARLAVLFYNCLYKKKVKSIHTFHGHIFKGYFSKAKSRMFIFIERLIGKITDVVIAISETQKHELSDEFRVAPLKKFRTIKLGFRLEPFLNCRQAKGKFRKQLGVGDDFLLIGIIGRFVPIKNHFLFLKAAKIFTKQYPLKRIKFVIVGDGELRIQLRDYVKELALDNDVVFCGWIKEITDVYADLDIVALTSFNEGTPVSIIEAMAASVPVVSTDVGGVRDLLGSPLDTGNGSNGFHVCERGIMCKSDDPVSFAKALVYMVDSQFGKSADFITSVREFITQNYSQKRLIRDIESLYLELCK